MSVTYFTYSTVTMRDRVFVSLCTDTDENRVKVRYKNNVPAKNFWIGTLLETIVIFWKISIVHWIRTIHRNAISVMSYKAHEKQILDAVVI